MRCVSPSVFSQCLAGTRLPLQPACIQDTVSIRSPNSQMEFTELGHKPQQCERLVAWQQGGKNHPLLRQYLFHVGTRLCRSAWCCTKKVRRLFCSSSARSQALQTLGSPSQTVPSRVSIPANGEAKIFCPCPPRHWESSCFIRQGGEASEDGVRLLLALPPALNPVFSPKMGPE